MGNRVSGFGGFDVSPDLGESFVGDSFASYYFYILDVDRIDATEGEIRYSPKWQDQFPMVVKQLESLGHTLTGEATFKGEDGELESVRITPTHDGHLIETCESVQSMTPWKKIP